MCGRSRSADLPSIGRRVGHHLFPGVVPVPGFGVFIGLHGLVRDFFAIFRSGPFRLCECFGIGIHGRLLLRSDRTVFGPGGLVEYHVRLCFFLGFLFPPFGFRFPLGLEACPALLAGSLLLEGYRFATSFALPSGNGPVDRIEDELSQGLTIRRCPNLHAKVVIIDAAAMYLGSANLTGAGLGAKSPRRHNFELRIWTRSSSLIDVVLAHFNNLWEGRQCRTCARRDVCPVPLEEPSP